MFKMNPEAKEFVPAHILKKRQEEATKVTELSEQLDQVDISSTKGELSTKNSASPSSARTNVSTNPVQDHHSKQTKVDSTANDGSSISGNACGYKSASAGSSEKNQLKAEESNGHMQEGHRVELQDLIEEEDRYILKAGENICEFNGEQFIIPGDDDYEPAVPTTGYDFGNAEDNEDEDVCNAFEEFLENLPNQ